MTNEQIQQLIAESSFAVGGIIDHPSSGDDSIPACLDRGCFYGVLEKLDGDRAG